MDRARDDHAASRRLRRMAPSLLLVAVMAAVTVRDGWPVIDLADEALAGRYATDDAFYYFELARHFPSPEFNEGITTTGFHPLWWLLLAPVFQLASGFTAVRGALLLGLALHLLAGWLLYRALDRRLPTAAAAGAAALWLAHPLTRTVSLLGVEAPLVACLLAALLITLDGPATVRRSLGVGALVGACYLARTDSVLVVAPIAAAWLLSRTPSAREALRLGAVAGAAASAVAAPWLTFLLLNGGLRSDSARAIAILRDARGHFRPVDDVVGGFLGQHLTMLLWPVDEVTTGTAASGWLLLAVAALTLAVIGPRLRPVEIGMAAGLGLLYVAQASVLGGMREWYAVYLLLGTFAILAPRLVLMMQRARLLPVAVPLVAVLVLLPTLSLHPQELQKVEAAKRLDVGTHRVGAFNAGIHQYVSPHEVVNLDGLVNPTVHGALRDRDLCRYMRSEGIRFVIDDVSARRKLLILAPGARIVDARPVVRHDDPERRQVRYELQLDC